MYLDMDRRQECSVVMKIMAGDIYSEIAKVKGVPKVQPNLGAFEGLTAQLCVFCDFVMPS